MKKNFCGLLLFLGITGFSFAGGIAEEAASGNEKADMSYAFGMVLASDFQQMGLEFNYGAFLRGFREKMENQETRYTMDEAIEIVEAAVQAAMEKQAAASLEEEIRFFKKNGERDGIVTTASGLQYEVLEAGSGNTPLSTDFVRVHYRGTLADGTVFDSSYDRGEPEEFPLTGVIPGWSEGILLMKEGGKSRLYIPSTLAYGARGISGFIPPNATLIFEVELLEIIIPEEGEAETWWDE